MTNLYRKWQQSVVDAHKTIKSATGLDSCKLAHIAYEKALADFNNLNK